MSLVGVGGVVPAPRKHRDLGARSGVGVRDLAGALWFRRIALAAAALAAFATTAQAEDCEAEQALLFAALDRNGLAVEDEGLVTEAFGTCNLSGLLLRAEAARLEVGRLEWKLDGAEALENGAGAIALDARLRDLRLVPEGAVPRSGSALSGRMEADGRLVVSWAVGTGALELEALDVVLPGGNGVSLGFAAGGMTTSLLDGKLSDLAALSLGRLELVIVSDGTLGGQVASILDLVVPDRSGASEAEIAAAVTAALEGLSRLPDTMLTDGSRDALERGFEEAPNFDGTLTLTLLAEPDLDLIRFAVLAVAPDPFALAALRLALGGARLEATYTRSAR